MTATHVHGEDGLGGVTMDPELIKFYGLAMPPENQWINKESAVDAILRLVAQYPNELTIITIGPLTNLGVAAKK